MPKLIVLRGNSGSGKTAVAKELQKRFGRNTMLISQDAVRRDMLKEKSITSEKELQDIVGEICGEVLSG